MPWTFPLCPAPPDWRLDWPAIEEALPVLATLTGVPQDPVWHAEGDVRTHTRLVAQSMITDPDWQALTEENRCIAFLSAILHDIGKGPTTRIEDGSVSSPRHSVIGQRMARRLLWESEQALPFAIREAITGLVRYHGLPLMFIEKPSPERSVIESSMTIRNDHVAILARADVLGRICPDPRELLDRIALFRELCAEQNCLTGPKAFASDHHRFFYFNAHTDYAYVPYDDTRCEATLLSGLPATGKDYWVTHHGQDVPVISLDDIRSEMEISPAQSQGAVANAAKDQAREYLRQHRSFIWNATNITKDLRQQLISLFANYKARVRIVYVECPPDEQRRRNRRRTVPVPEAVIERMIEKLEVPTPTEAHGLEFATIDA